MNSRLENSDISISHWGRITGEIQWDGSWKQQEKLPTAPAVRSRQVWLFWGETSGFWDQPSPSCIWRKGAGRAAAAARAGAGQAQHPLRIDSGFVTRMFDKACCYFSCPEIQSTVGGSSKEKSKYIKNSPLGALNTVGKKCADSQMFSFPHTSWNVSFIHIHVYIFPADALLNISKYSYEPIYFYCGICKSTRPWLYM